MGRCDRASVLGNAASPNQILRVSFVARSAPQTHDHVVWMIDNAKQRMLTVAGRIEAKPGVGRDPLETDPLKPNCPYIGSLAYCDRHLFVPTWDRNTLPEHQIRPGRYQYSLAIRPL